VLGHQQAGLKIDRAAPERAALDAAAHPHIGAVGWHVAHRAGALE